MIPRVQQKFIKDAIFISNTSLNDFLSCPRAYFLKNVYRNPKTGYRIQIASPYISLGATIHDAIRWFLENLDNPSLLKLNDHFRNFWWKYHGKRGGFSSEEEEKVFGQRGLKMLGNFLENHAKLEKMAKPAKFPKYPLIDNVILTGNLDYVGELDDGNLHVIDFKTGVKDVDSPLQLYIYAILAENHYGKAVTKMSFWYLDRDLEPKEVVPDPLEKTLEWLVEKGKAVKLALEENNWVCKGGDDLCRDCRDYQAVLEGKGEFMFSDHAYKKDVYFLEKSKPEQSGQ